MLKLEGVTVRFGPVAAVDGVDLSVGDGAGVLALLGPSGCGKSTLLRAVAGLEPLAAGTVTFDGVDLAGVPVHRRGFGLVFQDGQLFPHLTVAGNIGYGVPKAQRPDRVGQMLELVGLDGLGGRRVDQLSGGQAQRVALARALAPRPRLLLLDEPLSALDRELRDRLAEDLAGILRASGTPTILVTHDHGEAAALGDTVAVMVDGRIVQQGTPLHLWQHPAHEQVARFLGYTRLVDVAVEHGVATGVLGAVGVDAPDGPARLALRAQSLVLSPNGPVRAVVVSVAALPHGHLLRTVVDGVGEVAAVASLREEVAAGQQVRLWLDPRAVAVVGGTPPPRASVHSRTVPRPEGA